MKLRKEEKMSQFKKKIIILFLMIGLNYAGLSAVGETIAYYNDTEISSENTFSAGTLDFSIPATPDFSPNITPTQNSSRNISVINNGSLGFQYAVQTANPVGTLCSNLNLNANLDGGISEYTGSLTGFNYNAGQFIAPEDWVFVVTLTSSDSSLKNQTCAFDFIFNGVQISGAGFSDQEIISNTITSGQWVAPPSDACIKINEVYYDPDSSHGDADDEWIELYNACSHIVNLKNWYLEDNGGYDRREKLNHDYPIGPYQFVVIAANASTWRYWPNIPDNAFKIALGGTKMFSYGLRNDGDRVILKNTAGAEIDAVSWGSDDYAFGVGNGVKPATGAGHSIARKIKGVDTNSPDDWQKLTAPNPGTNPHSTNGEEIITGEFGNDLEQEEKLTEIIAPAVEAPVSDTVPAAEDPIAPAPETEEPTVTAPPAEPETISEIISEVEAEVLPDATEKAVAEKKPADVPVKKEEPDNTIKNETDGQI